MSYLRLCFPWIWVTGETWGWGCLLNLLKAHMHTPERKQTQEYIHHWRSNGAWNSAQHASSCNKGEEGAKKGKERWVASGPPRTPRISKMGLSLPRGCLFVSPRQRLKRERVKAAKVGAQEEAGWRGRWAFPGTGPPASSPFLLGDYAGVQSGAGRRAGAPRGGRRLESEKRGKWSWHVCQGSATYCTSNPE